MRGLLLFIGLFGLLTIPASAQLDRGTITGTVLDPSGAAVASAHIEIRNLATRETFDTVANEAGQYSRPNLPPGEYQIAVDAKGFKKLVRSGITLRVTDIVRVDLQLEIGSIADTVEVTAVVPRLQSESAEVGTAFDNKSLINLPLSFGSGGRRPDAFAFQVTPGVTGSAGTNPSQINGSTNYSKEMLVDGASVTVNQAGDPSAAIISPEALQEVKVQTAGLSAEYGRTQTGVFNYVMKSGTNQTHGSAYFGIRNEALNANTFANNFRGAPRSLDRKMDYAASLGGPVYVPKLYNGRNKTFFYFTYERYKERSLGLGAPTRTVPIPEFYKGDFSRLLGPATAFRDAQGGSVLQGAIYDPGTFTQLPGGRWIGQMFPGNKIPVARFSQVSRSLNSIAEAHYIPTVRDAQGLVPLQNNSYFPISGQPVWDRYQFAEKGDHIFSSSHRIALSVSHHYSPRLILDSGGMWEPGDANGGPLAKARNRGDSGQTVRLIEDWTISSRFLNNINVSFNHRGNPQTAIQSDVDGAALLGIKNLSTKGYPVVNWGGGPFVTQESAGFLSTSYRADMSWGVLDTVGFSIGRHFLKMGFDHRRMHQNNQASSNASFNFAARGTAIPNESFSGTSIGYSFASYLLGIVDSAAQTDVVPIGGRRNYWGAFIQDDFKFSSRLTLNLGLRWDFQPPALEVADRLSSWNPAKIDPLSGLPGAYDFAGSCSVCTGRRYFGAKDYKNFGPRIGFAWRGPASIILRGSYGILYEGDAFNSTGGATPLGKPTNVQAGGTYSLDSDPVTPWVGIFNWDSGFPTNRYKPAAYDISWGDANRPGMIDPNYGKSPYVQQWNFNIQREIFRRTVLDIGYLGNKGTRLREGELSRINQLPVSALAQYGTRLNNAIRNESDAKANGIAYPYPGFNGTVASALRAFPQVQGNQTVNVYGSPLGFSTYHSLQITLNREVKNGLLIYANYVWSKTLSNVDSSQNGENGSRPLDYYNLKLEKAVAESDRPHMVKAYIAYDLPFRGTGWTKNLFGGWTVLGIANYYSGTPMTFTAPTPLTAWNGAVNRANVAPGDLANPAFSKANFELSNPQAPQNTYLNKSLFSTPAPLTLGTAARRYTQIRGFGTASEDLSLQKTAWIKENLRFQLRAEFLNAFNRQQLGGINTAVNNLSFGQVTSISGNRQIQLGARLDF